MDISNGKNTGHLINDVRLWAQKYGLGKDWLLLCDRRKVGYVFHLGKDYSGTYIWEETDANPMDYCEYFPEYFIAGMAYDGVMYECLNGYSHSSAYRALEEMLDGYNLYIEHADSCHCAFVWTGNGDEPEYTYYARERKVYLYHPSQSETFGPIMSRWYQLSAKTGDVGSCVIGAGIEFTYGGQKYRISAQSPHQGSCSWEPHVPEVKRMLSDIGATDIWYDYGRMD